MPLPKSLRWQLRLALVALELLIVAGSLTAVYALRVSAGATRKLTEERLDRMQDANDLVQHTLLIERNSERMLVADSLDEMRTSYDEIIKQIEALDHLLAKHMTSAHPSVLALVEAGQLFRNTAHIIAGLRNAELQAGAAVAPVEQGRPASPLSPQPGPAGHEETLRHFHRQLQNQASAMVASAQELSASFTSDYREAVRQVADETIENERWVLSLVAGSLVLAWLVSRYLLGRQVLTRLQKVSNCLRQGDTGSEHPRVPVQGHDEIGEMARAVEQFLEDRQRLADVNKELESFSYSLSHDLRTPLRAIDGFCHILLENYADKLDADGISSLQKVRSATQRMGQLINDMLHLSRITRSEMHLELVDLSALVHELAEELKKAEPERCVEVVVEPGLVARADRQLIQIALTNLLGNAWKYTGRQGIARIEFGKTPGEGAPVYFVRDNGVGFDMAYADKLFGAFQRLHSATEFPGTGVGLAIVQRVIHRHGGRVWAEAELNRGATFFFTLNER